MLMKALPLARVYQLLEPGPVVLLTTRHKDRANVMTLSWHMMVDFEPPLVACVVGSAKGLRPLRRGRPDAPTQIGDAVAQAVRRWRRRSAPASTA